MSIVNGIFKGIWSLFSTLNGMLRSGSGPEVIMALGVYFLLASFVLSVYVLATSGSSYNCAEWRDDGLVSYYDSTTKTTHVRQERTCMVKVHKDFTGSVEIR